MDRFLDTVKAVIATTIATWTTVVSGIQSAPVEIQPTPIPSPTPAINQDIVARKGEYSYKSFTLKYSVSVPKKGGLIIGSFDGVCKGPISGKFEGGEGGKIEGTAQAECKIIFLTYNLKANYTGSLFLKEGKMDINWEGEIPYTPNKGSLSVNFEPAD